MKYDTIFLVLGVCFSMAACGPERPHLKTLKLNFEANQKLKKQEFPIASSGYLEALRFDPFAEPLHLNLGLSFEGQQQAENAVASYRVAEKLAHEHQNRVVEFIALFNQAQLLGKGKKVDEALAVYQKALDLNPSSKEVKHNIELLTQQKGSGEGEGKGEDKGESEGKKDQNQSGEGKDKEDQPKEVQQSPKYKPRPFQGKELSDADVKKILGELKQQEEKIRAEYNKKEMKEQPRDKDW